MVHNPAAEPQQRVQELDEEEEELTSRVLQVIEEVEQAEEELVTSTHDEQHWL